ncbi:Flagellar hook-associated protein flgK [Hyphomicrobiales bacterium]|nr:Flagellar hook-associated protein flgK [Hyphomicrobiales bacterium]CAH1696212.1 Flagellar hook-associated protein flgK [Hyphomicrobiales bacterium]
MKLSRRSSERSTATRSPTSCSVPTTSVSNRLPESTELLCDKFHKTGRHLDDRFAARDTTRVREIMTFVRSGLLPSRSGNTSSATATILPLRLLLKDIF